MARIQRYVTRTALPSGDGSIGGANARVLNLLLYSIYT